MQLIEFIAKSQDGLIRIPDTYKDWYNDTVKVILLRESKLLPQETERTELERFFAQFNADLTGYSFTCNRIYRTRNHYESRHSY